MDKSVFLEKVKEQFLDLEGDISADSNFRDIDSYDSLTGMMIMVMIKDEFNVDITEAEYRSKKTVSELYDFAIQNQK
ncbi:MAG TPA: acyl carrier protein [Flavobacterium sp.]|jgi:acyl carrier protein